MFKSAVIITMLLACSDPSFVTFYFFLRWSTYDEKWIQYF